MTHDLILSNTSLRFSDSHSPLRQPRFSQTSQDDTPQPAKKERKKERKKAAEASILF